MPDLADFHFLRPWWLLALVLLPLIPVLLRRKQQGGSSWIQHCDPALLPHVLIQPPLTHTIWTRALLWLACTLAVLALAGPTVERLPKPAYRDVSALAIVLDLSPAMEATDLKPKRIERARYKIIDLLERRHEGQSALLVFGGAAFTVTPLTDDAATIEAQLNALTPAILPVQGQRTDLALEQAIKLLQQAGIEQGDVLLVSSGGLTAPATQQASAIANAGFRLSVLGVGTSEGSPLPLPGGGFLKSRSGTPIIARKDTEALTAMAELGGGQYRDLSDDTRDIDELLAFFERHRKTQDTLPSTTRLDTWQELGSWLLLPLLPLAALGFRRGWLGIALLACLVTHADPGSALDWQNLWHTPDQRAMDALNHGHPEQAAQLFENPDWKAAAAYKAGQYPASAELLKNREDAPSLYNLGNSLARQGQYQDALDAYQRALEQNPADADTLYNRDLVKKALEQQQKQDKPPENKPQSKKENQPGKSGDKPDNESKTAHSDAPDQPDQPDQPSQPDQPDQSPQADHSPDSKSQDSPKPGEQDDSKNFSAADTAQQAEGRQADEQWLRRIPDDPGGLLRRKFYYQYQQRMLEK
ncbi:MAG: vWA domain-containing protein [Methylococcaceae bacterium]